MVRAEWIVRRNPPGLLCDGGMVRFYRDLIVTKRGVCLEVGEISRTEDRQVNVAVYEQVEVQCEYSASRFSA